MCDLNQGVNDHNTSKSCESASTEKSSIESALNLAGVMPSNVGMPKNTRPAGRR